MVTEMHSLWQGFANGHIEIEEEPLGVTVLSERVVI